MKTKNKILTICTIVGIMFGTSNLQAKDNQKKEIQKSAYITTQTENKDDFLGLGVSKQLKGDLYLDFMMMKSMRGDEVILNLGLKYDFFKKNNLSLYAGTGTFYEVPTKGFPTGLKLGVDLKPIFVEYSPELRGQPEMITAGLKF
ncbi:MAG: hypothetical protein ABIC91_05260 [Nanoarchaeota archaeon]|nr:hypothetical protein [Nanoarchaeota archaeon]MBU1030790.1 hypothetical protein [Nanoarchaeota archaeon]MBU1849982.1 hypothetical protein [Nanoarchaeota archaeon]